MKGVKMVCLSVRYVKDELFDLSIKGFPENIAKMHVPQTVVPGFEFSDHDFLNKQDFEKMVPKNQQGELDWLLRDDSKNS